jgi:hypothetical protein
VSEEELDFKQAAQKNEKRKDDKNYSFVMIKVIIFFKKSHFL